MTYCSLAVVLLLPAAVSADALTEVSVEINVAELEATVDWLADDEREGRGLANPGLEAAAVFLAERFEAIGLQQVPGLEDYSHPFDLPMSFGYESKSLAAGDEPLAGDFEPFNWASPGTFEGDLVFAGYGITREGHDDYADLDVDGKVVLVLRYEPYDVDGTVQATGTDRMGNDATFTRKVKLAQDNGAVGLLVVNPPMHSRDEGLSSFGMGRPFAKIPALHIDRELASDLLDRARLPDLAYLQGRLDAGGPSSLASDLFVSGGFESTGSTSAVRNIVGMVEGKTPDEYVVVGAHYDHIGRGEYGSRFAGEDNIHNGADDNASGTATLIEVAEAIANGEQPERSVIFIGFTAEEIGLVGSREFVTEPPIEQEKIVAMLNLDMVGRIRDEKVFVGGAQTADAFGSLVSGATTSADLVEETMPLGGNSDHAPFISAGIPAVFLFSGLHDEYHGPDDDVELINFDGMTRLARAATDITYGMAAAPADALKFKNPNRTGVRLGVAVEPGGDGLTIGQVVDGSPAGAAGVVTGDVITAIDGRDVPTLAALRVALGRLDFGDSITLTVDRDGEPVELDVTFPQDE